MTDLTIIDLSTLNLKSLQNLAKEFHIKNWWTKKKADLLTELTTIKLDQEDQAAVKKANEDYQKELKKSKKSTKAPQSENLVTLKDLAAEFHMTGMKARRLLRNAAISRPYGGNRWEWDSTLHTDELEMAREYLKAHTKKEK